MADEIEKAPEGWERRQLCPDGACIGIIGANGLCTECGVPAPEEVLDPRKRGMRAEEEVSEAIEARKISHATPTAPADWEDRALCPDGACIGLIGDDGRCRECGMAAQADAEAEDADDT